MLPCDFFEDYNALGMRKRRDASQRENRPIPPRPFNLGVLGAVDLIGNLRVQEIDNGLPTVHFDSSPFIIPSKTSCAAARAASAVIFARMELAMG